MILVTFTRKFVDSLKSQAEYKWFENIELFVDWLQRQGTLAYSLTKGSRSLTQHGWVKRTESPAQILQAMDTNLKMVLNVNKIISDEGILFDSLLHNSDEIVRHIEDKCHLKHKEALAKQ